jgi:hypothetical protein
LKFCAIKVQSRRGASAEEAMAGVVLSLQFMLDIALGNEPEEGYFRKRFAELRG